MGREGQNDNWLEYLEPLEVSSQFYGGRLRKDASNRDGTAPESASDGPARRISGVESAS